MHTPTTRFALIAALAGSGRELTVSTVVTAENVDRLGEIAVLRQGDVVRAPAARIGIGPPTRPAHAMIGQDQQFVGSGRLALDHVSDVRDDAELDAFVRAEAESAYHPCGTCRMGAADDAGAVVDPECRVIGVEPDGADTMRANVTMMYRF